MGIMAKRKWKLLFSIQGSGLRAQSLGFGMQGLVLRASGSGFRV